MSKEFGSILILLSGFAEAIGIPGLLDAIGLDAEEEIVAMEEDRFIAASRDLDTTLSSSFCSCTLASLINSFFFLTFVSCHAGIFFSFLNLSPLPPLHLSLSVNEQLCLFWQKKLEPKMCRTSMSSVYACTQLKKQNETKTYGHIRPSCFRILLLLAFPHDSHKQRTRCLVSVFSHHPSASMLCVVVALFASWRCTRACRPRNHPGKNNYRCKSLISSKTISVSKKKTEIIFAEVIDSQNIMSA